MASYSIQFSLDTLNSDLLDEYTKEYNRLNGTEYNVNRICKELIKQELFAFMDLRNDCTVYKRTKKRLPETHTKV